MEDQAIIDLYFARSETAIAETEQKFGNYCRTIAGNILRDGSDSEECVSDTWLRAWDAIPPERPARLGTFLGRITRNLALVDSMSQEIGLSKIVGDITVDVDSALFGDRGFKILLRVRGREFTMGDGIWFTDWSMELDPDPTAGMGHGRGREFAGIDNDGTLLLFFECYWDEPKRPDAPFTVRLSMTDLVLTGAGGVVEEVIQAGTWDFEFPLEITGVPEPVSLPGCTVTVKDPERGQMVDVELKNLTLYSTGLAYEKADPDAPSLGVDVTVVLKNGGSIRATLGIGDTRWWDVPVEPSEVTSIRIGETEILIP